jgi:hypothetical protein
MLSTIDRWLVPDSRPVELSVVAVPRPPLPLAAASLYVKLLPVTPKIV